MLAFEEFWRWAYNFVIEFRFFAQQVWDFMNSERTIMGETYSVFSIMFGAGLGVYLVFTIVKYVA